MNEIVLLSAGVVAGIAVLSAIAALAWRFGWSVKYRWLLTYVCERSRRRSVRLGETVHVLLCIADHFEPKADGATDALAAARVERWVEEYPNQLGEFRDSDGRPPRHTFFYPIEEYEPEFLDRLAELCRLGYGEVEIHLHHCDDTADRLRADLLRFRNLLAESHGLLARDSETGEVVYAFVHGNWALDNSHPKGHWCGVNNELDVLRETGCYADFTLPGAPDGAQTRKINSIYYAVDDPRRPKSHDWGTDVGAAPAPARAFLLVQGPLLLNWTNRKWGLLPRLENGCLQGSQPPTIQRLERWLQARVQVATRPDWFFVKLHTHGTGEANHRALLGDEMTAFHQALAERSARDPNFHYHYVTAREMANLVRAAEAGWAGSVDEARDFRFSPPACVTLLAANH